MILSDFGAPFGKGGTMVGLCCRRGIPIISSSCLRAVEISVRKDSESAVTANVVENHDEIRRIESEIIPDVFLSIDFERRLFLIAKGTMVPKFSISFLCRLMP